MLDFIERLRAKPEHVRRRIAYGTAAGVSGVVAVVWLFALVVSGTFALSNPYAPSSGTLAQTSGSQVVGAVTQTKSAWSQLLGAVGAAGTQTYSGTSAAPVANNAPGLTVEDAASTSDAGTDTSGATAGLGGDQTTISF